MWRSRGLTAEHVVLGAEPLAEGLEVLGGAEPAGNHVVEEAVVLAHRLQARRNSGSDEVPESRTVVRGPEVVGLIPDRLGPQTEQTSPTETTLQTVFRM